MKCNTGLWTVALLINEMSNVCVHNFSNFEIRIAGFSCRPHYHGGQDCVALPQRVLSLISFRSEFIESPIFDTSSHGYFSCTHVSKLKS